MIASLAFAREHQIQRSRKEDHLSFTFTNNIVRWDCAKLLDGQWQDKNVVMNRNLYWRTDGGPLDFAGRSFDAWKKSGQDEGSVIADPKFADAGKRDFHLHRDNPALPRSGFKPFNFSQAGVYGNATWKQLAAANQLRQWNPRLPRPTPDSRHRPFIARRCESSGAPPPARPGSRQV